MSQPGLGRILAIPLLFMVGCDSPPPEPPSPVAPAAAIGAQFDPSAVGSISGRVIWDGDIPTFPPVIAPAFLPSGVEKRQYRHPNAPDIDAATRAVRGAVVYLNGVDPTRSRAWDHAAVRIEIQEDRIAVISGGGTPQRVGFVQRGDYAEMVSKDAAIHVLSARGAAFFALAFPDANRPLRRAFDKAGLVDLSSAAGKYWHRAYLFVADHPYYALTDTDGRFTLEGVPAGEYTLKCWLPNATVERTERDPNTGLTLRFVHAPPLESTQQVRVGAGDRQTTRITLSR